MLRKKGNLFIEVQVSPDEIYVCSQDPIKPNGKTHNVKYIQRLSGAEDVKNRVIKLWPRNGKKQPGHAIEYETRFSGTSVISGSNENNTWMVTNYHGSNLKSFLKVNSGLISVEARIQIINALLAKVAEFEQAGIFHRNLKPENIFVKLNDSNKRYEVNITGFDLATPNTDTKNHGGNSVDYSAPDDTISHASDRYSLGPIIAEILGCSSVHMLQQRTAESRRYERLSSEEQQKYKASQLPGYDFSSLPSKDYPEKSSIRQDLFRVLNAVTHKQPEQRSPLNYLQAFFRNISYAFRKEESKDFFEKGMDITSNFVNKADYTLEVVDNVFMGSKIKAKDRPILNNPLEQNFFDLTEQQMRQSPEYLLHLIGTHRHKFAGTNSTGILEFFSMYDKPCSAEDKMQAMLRIGLEKENPGCLTSLFACLFYKPRNSNIGGLYAQFANLNGYLNIRDGVGILDRIERSMATTQTFVGQPQQQPVVDNQQANQRNTRRK